jgi:type IV pilus assembly protein PilC
MKQKNHRVHRYQWKGINRQGEKLHGFIEANNLIAAKMKLREQEMIVHTLRRTFKYLKINKQEINWFNRQLVTLLQSGLPLTIAFDILNKSQHNPSMSSLILAIKQDIHNGFALSSSFKKYPAYFSSLFCSLIAVGETTGLLEVMMDKANVYHETVALIQKKIKKTFAS